MSDILRTIDHMKAKGVAAEAILEAVYALEAARADKLEQRREADRGRQRRNRMNQRLDTEAIVSRDTSTVTPGGQPDPQGFSPTPPFPKPPLSLSLSGAHTREERLALQRDLQQNHWQEIIEVCRNRANGAIDPDASGVMHAGDLIQLMCPLEGEPCDLEADMLPAIDAKAAQAHKTGKPIRSWSWIREPALQNRDRRLAGLPPPEKPNGRSNDATGGAGASFRRGPSEDAFDRLRRRMGGQAADADVIEHPRVLSGAGAGSR